MCLNTICGQLSTVRLKSGQYVTWVSMKQGRRLFFITCLIYPCNNSKRVINSGYLLLLNIFQDVIDYLQSPERPCLKLFMRHLTALYPVPLPETLRSLHRRTKVTLEWPAWGDQGCKLSIVFKSLKKKTRLFKNCFSVIWFVLTF